MSIWEFIQSYGQPLAQGLFIVILLLLLLYMLIVRPKATCCSVTRIHHDDVGREESALAKRARSEQTEAPLK